MCAADNVATCSVAVQTAPSSWPPQRQVTVGGVFDTPGRLLKSARRFFACPAAPEPVRRSPQRCLIRHVSLQRRGVSGRQASPSRIHAGCIACRADRVLRGCRQKMVPDKATGRACKIVHRRGCRVHAITAQTGICKPRLAQRTPQFAASSKVLASTCDQPPALAAAGGVGRLPAQPVHDLVGASRIVDAVGTVPHAASSMRRARRVRTAVASRCSTCTEESQSMQPSVMLWP